MASKNGLITIYNPSPVPSAEEVQSVVPWHCVDFLVINEDEARALADRFCEPAHSDALDALANHLSGAIALVMTKGAGGVEALVSAGRERFQRVHAPAGTPVGRIIDTTGAGDTFTVGIFKRYPDHVIVTIF